MRRKNKQLRHSGSAFNSVACTRGITAAGRPLCLGFILAFAVALISPAHASTLFALVDTGELFTSTDGGADWSLQSTLPISDAAGLLAAATASDLFLASQSGTVYNSTDAGATWNAVGAISASDLVDLAGRTDGALLALTRTGTLWTSTDNGVSFTAQASLGASDLVSLARGDDGTLLALTETGTVRRSDDGGTTWNAVGTLPVSDAIAVRPLASDYFILTETGLTYESIDAGNTWSAVGTVSQVGMSGLIQDEEELVAMNSTGLTARSSDGTSWSWVGTVNQVNVVAVPNNAPQTTSVPVEPSDTVRIMMAAPRPNPARPGSAIQVSFTLPQSTEASLNLFDTQGRRVAARSAEAFGAGQSVVNWNLPALGSGVYFLELSAPGHSAATTRLVILES